MLKFRIRPELCKGHDASYVNGYMNCPSWQGMIELVSWYAQVEEKKEKK
jgi:hypothetical protein